MLRELAVQNLALIEDVRVELDAGFCAWTGETGAGKSLLLGAIGLLLGERGSAELIRAGQEELRVVGRFELSRPEQQAVAAEILGAPLEDDDLVLTRRLSRSGRSSALVNESPVSVATLRKLGEMLVDVHGQRESYSLLHPAYQLELLDAFGKLTDKRADYVSAAERVRELRHRRTELTEHRQTRQRELALLRFERDELTAAELQPREVEAIQKERERLLHAQELAKFHAGSAAKLYDNDGSVVEILGKLIRDAQHWSRLDDKIAAVAKRLEALKPELQDIAETCRDLSDAYEADPQRLDEVEQRLQTLKKLEARYGRGIDDLIVYRDALDAKEQSLRREEDNLATVDRDLRIAFDAAKTAAIVLSKARSKVAKKLAAEAQAHLADLQMARARLDAVLEPVPLGDDPTAGELPAAGSDHLELMLTANPGEPSRPLRKVASGGELSRTMLALKTVLAAHDPVRTLVVFDEIDANVGGRLGDVLGRKLARLGATHQVLCVTHLPQVASYASRHWTIRKSTAGKRTTTTITPLMTDTARIEELALMLRGDARTDTTLKEASEMLNATRKAR